MSKTNWTHVRQYPGRAGLGYARFDKQEITSALNELYTSEWRLLFNFFIPSVKLIEESRRGSKIIKKYDQPKTPCQRILESPEINNNTKQQLQTQSESYIPFLLQEQIKRKIKHIMTLVTTQTLEEKDP